MKRMMAIVLVVVAVVAVFLTYVAVSNGPMGSPDAEAGEDAREFLRRKDVDAGDKPRAWLAGDPAGSGHVLENVRAYLELIHMDIAGEGSCTLRDVGSGDVLVFCSPDVGEWMDPEDLAAYISEGGRVILAAGADGIAQDTQLMKALGIRSLRGRTNCHELAFDEPFLPVQPDKTRYDGASASRMMSLSPDATVCIRDAQTDNPIVYTFDWKKGAICLINGAFLEDTHNMGLLSGALSAVIPDFIYPVVGTGTLFLDSFPYLTSLSSEQSQEWYGYSTEGLVRDVLWPAFQGVSLRTGLPCVASLPVSASALESAADLDDEVVATVGGYVLKFNGELAYASEGGSEMREELVDRYAALFPGYTVRGLTLPEDGADALVDGAPAGIDAVRGWLEGDDAGLGWGDGVAFYPAATTSATRMDEGGVFSLCSVLGAYGLVSHVLDVDEMALDWDAAKRELGTLEAAVLDKARWLEGRTLAAARDDVRSYDAMDYNWTVDGDTVRLDCSGIAKGQAFLFRPDGTIRSASGLQYQEAGNGYYLLRAQEDAATITLERGD